MAAMTVMAHLPTEALGELHTQQRGPGHCVQEVVVGHLLLHPHCRPPGHLAMDPGPTMNPQHHSHCDSVQPKSLFPSTVFLPSSLPNNRHLHQ